MIVRENQYQENIETVIQYEEEKNSLRDNLDDLIDEHEILKDEYGDLSSQLEQRDSTILAYADEIKQLLRSKGELTQARAKIRRLKEISKRYVSAIDSLYTLNQILQLENDSVKKANQLISIRNRTLEKNNQDLSDQVFTASMLRVENIQIEGVYYRSSGREVTTTRASKIQNFSICFDIIENKVTEAGLKDIYIRIIDPRGEVLNVANKIQEITINTDSVVQYTTNYSFDYANQKISECQLWTRGNVLIPGIYYFEFIMGGEIIGISNTKFR
jgi:myosin heavy subunit